MTIQLFLIILTIVSTISSIITEGIKTFLQKENIHFSSNILATIVAVIVGVGGTIIYYIFGGIEFTCINIICVILMGLASSLASMLGYDKIVQTIKQIGSKGGK